MGLNKQNPDLDRHLVYCHWEPVNGDAVHEVVEHRAEIARFADMVADAQPAFHAISYDRLWREWDALTSTGWIADHVRALRARYAVSLDLPDAP